MLNKNQFLDKYPGVREGLNAFSQDGEKLGKVIELNDDYVTIEKGYFFPRDFTFRYDNVVDVKNDQLVISKNKSELSNWRDENYKGWQETSKANDMTVPVKEEELEVYKVAHQTGEVRVRKVVHTEMKSFTVPVSREEVIIERNTVKGSREPKAGETEFKEGETVIPIMEEEIEIRKRPVVKEELRIHKETYTEEKKVSGEIKKEDVQVEREDKGKRKAA